MPKFFYIARDNAGNKLTGTEDAVSQDELIGRLQSRNLLVVQVTPEGKSAAAVFNPDLSGGKMKFKHYGVSSDDLVVFCRQLATLLGAAVSILKSLDAISKQVASKRLYNIIKDLQRSMEAGLSFHEAMSKHPRVFSELWINLVETGEASGNLAIVLNRLATHLERDAAFKKKVISALVYPFILMTASIGALLFLTIKIIPTFAELFKGFNVTLPFLTQILINVSNFMRKFFLIIFGGGVAGFFLLRAYMRTREGRIAFENFQFRLPLLGEFFRSLIVERFSSGMSTLIESGVPILYSLEIAEHSMGNYVMSEIVRKIKEDVREGKLLSASLEKSNFFEPMVVQMVAVGEEVGDLPQMFKRVNAFYQEYAETFLTRFTAMFEPIMLLFMGLVIGVMVIGMFLPIFKIATMGGG